MPRGKKSVLGIKGSHRSGRIDKVVSEMAGGAKATKQPVAESTPVAKYEPSAEEFATRSFGVPIQEGADPRFARKRK
jgi:hypothetical protein